MITFTPSQIKELFGGKFPYARGFDWSRVEEFRLEDGVLQPYAGDDILPAPAISIDINLARDPFDQPRSAWRALAPWS